MPESSKLKPSQPSSKSIQQAKLRKVKRGRGYYKKTPQSLVSHLQEIWANWMGQKSVAKNTPKSTAKDSPQNISKGVVVDDSAKSFPKISTKNSHQNSGDSKPDSSLVEPDHSPSPSQSFPDRKPAQKPNQSPEPKSEQKKVQRISRKRDRDRPNYPPIVWALLSTASTVIGTGMIAAIVITAILALTHPDSPFLVTPRNIQSCQAKLNGQWQSNWGSISFQEQANSANIVGKYDYDNLDRGKVQGTLTGNLSGNTLDFNWQETSQRGQAAKGKGSFLFQNDCKDFYGSYGLDGSESGRGNWRGSVSKIVPLKK